MGLRPPDDERGARPPLRNEIRPVGGGDGGLGRHPPLLGVLELLEQRIPLAALLGELLRSARALGFNGLNITHPCKQAVIPLLDALSPDAEALQAVNTVVLRDGRRVGHLTIRNPFG